MEIMRKRASLSTISGAEDNVDLGALLNSFLTLPSSNLLHSILSSTGSVYQGVVVSYDRDAELADVSGNTDTFDAQIVQVSHKKSPLQHLMLEALLRGH